MPLKFGLSLKSSTGNTSKPAPAKRKALFDADDDSDNDNGQTSSSTTNAQSITTFDEQQDVTFPQASTTSTKPPQITSTKPSNPKIPPFPPSSCSTSTATGPTLSSQLHSKAISSTAESLDPSIYDYDAHYATSSSHALEQARRASARDAAASGTPQYMDSMIASAKTRERDQLRAKDKMLQKEREAEGDELKDTEQFVTGAYREQQEAVRRAEEEERAKEEKQQRERKGKGMTGFWKEMMDEEEERHRKLAEGLTTAQNDEGSGAEDTNVGADEKEQAAAKLAREMNAKGANVVINEDGLVADKRQLLTAGLNITPTPRSSTVSSAAVANAKAAALQKREATFAQGQNRGAREAQRDRQTRMMEAQLEASQKRTAEEEVEALQKREVTAKSQKTGADISSAKERYLQRKREAAKALEKGKT